MEVGKEEDQSDHMTILKCEVLNFIANCDGAHFKSQQRGDPDLTLNEKRCIASDILEKNPGRFLSRFWSFLLPSHLPYFASLDNDEDYELKFYLEQLEKKFHRPPPKALIKNRRLEAMKRLAIKTEYFTDEEMKKRNPLLYEQLVRKYMSREERIADSMPDTENKTFSTIILDKIERDEVHKLMESQQFEELDDDDVSDMEVDDRLQESSDSDASLDRYGGTWGEIDKQPKKKILQKRERRKKQAFDAEKEISDDEKKLLLAEFRSTMHSQFLLGKDKDFDYSEVDTNEDYDNLDMIEIDEQDTYFDSESPSGQIDFQPITEGISRLGS